MLEQDRSAGRDLTLRYETEIRRGYETMHYGLGQNFSAETSVGFSNSVAGAEFECVQLQTVKIARRLDGSFV